GRANTPWIQFYNYKTKYAPNPVVDFLAANSTEYRTTQPTFLNISQAPFFHPVYADWLGHLFQYNNVQSFDVIQLPRMPVDYQALMVDTFTNAAQYVRLWELTSTRWILSPTALLPEVNQQLDKGKERFKVALKFDLTNGEGNNILAVTNGPGNFAVLDFTGALPRAKVYSSWIVEPGDKASLQKISDPAFDPHAQVVVNATALPGSGDPRLAEASSVSYESYAPKKTVLKVKTNVPGVLLLNDKYDPDWKVSVDGSPKELLRSNYLMRGVQVPAGDHQVVFEFKPKLDALYVSLGATIIGLGLCGFLLVSKTKEQPTISPVEPKK
ncbi:MAG: hypothetical protein JWM04_741, partial [Verrucomicrobiales bacterium]|nr:hypothetical protein [Verrucomicrobiales bacterium]